MHLVNAFANGLMLLATSEVPTGGFNWADIQTILTSITASFSLANLVATLGGILTITAGFGIFWFSARKAVRLVQSAVKTGKIRV